MKLIKRLENVHYSERLKELNLFILTTVRRDLIIVCKYLNGKRMLLIEISQSTYKYNKIKWLKVKTRPFQSPVKQIQEKIKKTRNMSLCVALSLYRREKCVTSRFHLIKHCRATEFMRRELFNENFRHNLL